MESLKQSPAIPRKSPIPEQKDYVVRRVEAQPVIEQPVRMKTQPIVKNEVLVNQVGVIEMLCTYIW